MTANDHAIGSEPNIGTWRSSGALDRDLNRGAGCLGEDGRIPSPTMTRKRRSWGSQPIQEPQASSLGLRKGGPRPRGSVSWMGNHARSEFRRESSETRGF